MRFTKYLAKTFLVYTIMGAGTGLGVGFGIGVMTILTLKADAVLKAKTTQNETPEEAK